LNYFFQGIEEMTYIARMLIVFDIQKIPNGECISNAIISLT
jgi:hypothetical protein